MKNMYKFKRKSQYNTMYNVCFNKFNIIKLFFFNFYNFFFNFVLYLQGET